MKYTISNIHGAPLEFRFDGGRITVHKWNYDDGHFEPYFVMMPHEAKGLYRFIRKAFRLGKYNYGQIELENVTLREQVKILEETIDMQAKLLQGEHGNKQNL